jgi:hypothetical protein
MGIESHEDESGIPTTLGTSKRTTRQPTNSRYLQNPRGQRMPSPIKVYAARSALETAARSGPPSKIETAEPAAPAETAEPAGPEDGELSTGDEEEEAKQPSIAGKPMDGQIWADGERRWRIVQAGPVNNEDGTKGWHVRAQQIKDGPDGPVQDMDNMQGWE